jgi:hypothetical protein
MSCTVDTMMDQLNMGVSVNKENTTTSKKEKFVMSKFSQDVAGNKRNV